ncbi:MAG: alpha/beta hydrolase, partial [Raoultibacter sp.]
MVVGIVIVAVLIGIAVALALYVDNNRNGETRLIEKAYAAGFIEKHTEIDGATMNYAEGPDNGPALLLIHGQTSEWEDYARVLPDLAKTYHVFAIDCFGHGESAHDPALYTCATQGQACISFASEVIGGDYLVSGLSSGGIIAAWIAANDPDRVQACVLEDPPLFRVTPEQMQEAPGTFVWRDGFEITHNYLAQDEIDDLAVSYA